MKWAVVLSLTITLGCSPAQKAPAPDSRRKPPERSSGLTVTDPLPPQLSQVGVLRDTRAMRPVESLLAYDVNVPFWSDGAQKRRWLALPGGKTIGFSPTGDWAFPEGTVFVKHFDLPSYSGDAAPRRLETRVLICGAGGKVRGASYRWREDGSDADLITEPTTADITPGRRYYFPGPQDCVTCHTPATGGVLGVKTRQMNRALGGKNQLVSWQRRGMFAASLPPLRPEELPRLARLDDGSQSLSTRARSYLDANCSNCHRPGGVAGNFDTRFETPAERQNLVGGPVLIDLGLDHAKVIAPGDVWRSVLLARIETLDRTRMPPIGHETVDREGAKLLRAWIRSLPARPVLDPPTIAPKGGEFDRPQTVTLRHVDPGATVRYTLDGSRPLASSQAYQGPIRIDEPVTLRAAAFKEGASTSITVQETFVVTPPPEPPSPPTGSAPP